MLSQNDIATPNPKGSNPISTMSIIAWGLSGFVVGFIIGGLGMDISGLQGRGGAVVNIRVMVKGLTLRQGTGPASMDRIIGSWSTGIIAAFSLAGATLFGLGRVLMGSVLNRNSS